MAIYGRRLVLSFHPTSYQILALSSPSTHLSSHWTLFVLSLGNTTSTTWKSTDEATQCPITRSRARIH
eukprot:5266255-Heterocapsa_arctica.AAC.1